MSDDKPDFTGEGFPGQYLNWSPRFGTGMWDGTFSPMGPDGQSNQDLRFAAPPDIDKYFGDGARYEKVADIPPPLPGNPGASVWAPVFKDGTRIPESANVFDTGKGKYQANSDGTFAPWTPAGTGETLRPTSYTLTDGKYTPIDKTGNAIGRPEQTIPNRDQWMADPRDANRLIPDPSKVPPAAPGAAPGGEGLSTDEENSGRAADAIRKSKEDFAKKKTSLHEAEQKLTEIMLEAKAADVDGRNAVQGIQKDVIAGLQDYQKHSDDPAYELQFLKFLREKAAEAGDLLENNKIAAADKARMAMALADFYKEGGDTNSSGPGGQVQPPGQPSMTDPRLTNPGAPGLLSPDPGAVADPGLGPAPAMPDPTAADVLGGGMGPGSPFGDALSAAAPLLQGLPGQLGAGGGGGGFDVGALTKPITDAISGAAGGGDHGRGGDGEGRDGEHGRDGKDEHDKPGRDEKPDPNKPEPKPEDPNKPPAAPGAVPAPGTNPDVTPPAAPTVPSTTVDLKDGASVTAADANRAGALRDALKGTPAGEAYRLNNLSVPPPGTTLAEYVRPNDLQASDYAMYKDRIEMIVDPSKWVGAGGQLQPMSTLPQGEGFEGFGRPTAASAPAQGAPGVIPAATTPAATPAPASGLGQSVVPPPTPRK
ncbi:DUF4226 domain-containing protein [Mycobacteroides salmoniphilum]|uniref:DUF4226 domain-containing protein n=1 Tax=Mycobacteroides salmoniphilum TaxID=404941 RepID=UPI00356B0EDE